MIVTIIIISLVFSFTLHFFMLAIYVKKKSKKSIIGFIATGVSNAFIMGILIFVSMRMPHLVREVDFKFLMWLISGIILLITLSIKIVIFARVFKRRRNPDCYHINYFGKKVYNDKILKKSEFIIVIATIPFFLMVGAYFIAILINIVMYGHL